MKISLFNGNYYHIYNRGNNRSDIFLENQDYLHFLELYAIYIESIANTFAWCLMKNHFHVLVRIKEKVEIGYLDGSNSESDDLHLKWKTYFPEIPDSNFIRRPTAIKQFQHLFSAYSKWFNTRHKRTGAVFENTYERKLVDHQKYFQNMILYIHQNPIKHGFVEHILDYPWTSYRTVLSDKPTNLKRDMVIDGFKNEENFTSLHHHFQDDTSIEHLIIE